MKLEQRNAVLSNLKDNYWLVRDEDWEVLCLVWRDDEWYYALYMEHYNLTKDEVEQLLDKSSWIAFVPVVDEEAKELYKASLINAETCIKEQIEKL